MDDVGTTFKGTPLSGGHGKLAIMACVQRLSVALCLFIHNHSCICYDHIMCVAGDQQAQHFALISKGSKTYAVPVEWFYVFKKNRKEAKTEEELAEEAQAKQQREEKVSRAFNKKFQIKDEPSACRP